MKKKPKLRDVILKAREQPKAIWTPRPEILCCQKIPKPLHGVVPREILGTSWWNKTRREAYRSTDFHCIACGVEKYKAKFKQHLEGHEVYEIDYLEGIATYVETVPLCNACHNFIHDGRLKSLMERGIIHQSRYAAVIQHGEAVLKANNLKRERYEGPMADWGEWRLIVYGKSYGPKYKDELDHAKQLGESDGQTGEDGGM